MLKQAISFRPFPREFIMLALIARRASQHEVTDVIGWNVCTSNTTQRKRMIDVMLSPLNFLVAIIAFALLSIILLTNLLCSISSLDSHFSRSTIMNGREFDHLAFFSLSVLSMPLLIVIFMCFPIRLMPFPTLFSIWYMTGWTLEFLLLEVFRVFLPISFVVFSLLFTMSNIILFLFLAMFLSVSSLLFCYLSFMLLSVSFFAILTSCVQPIFTKFGTGKVFRSGRKCATTGTGALLHQSMRSVIHDLNCLSFSALFSRLSGCKAYIFSSGVITPSLDNQLNYNILFLIAKSGRIGETYGRTI